MTFTIVSHLRELMLQLVNTRLERRIREERERERRELEVRFLLLTPNLN